ncbi:protein chibby homolog 1 isoform X1 [Prionailurus bengalensis]|uniref:Protein chibby homolog 1 isoform X1 n=5 Tax=Felidae TaxID=9681 RepID=A0A6J2A9M3_ACIJB|nr:protein chibby homolog 1 isoform X1 [Acinonyx jubatus]XP_043418531.1 protein chibby homolog 1 isoform X1 [Prionailurus bengalensis]
MGRPGVLQGTRGFPASGAARGRGTGGGGWVHPRPVSALLGAGFLGEGSIGLSFIRPKMPLFGNTFSPKKTPPRKSASLSNLHNLDRSTREVELGLDYGTPTMNLAGQSLKFENGQWIAEMGISGGVDRREAQRLRRRNQQLEEENNLLRLKVDILLDMLSETTAESHLMEKELEELKSTSRRRK